MLLKECLAAGCVASIMMLGVAASAQTTEQQHPNDPSTLNPDQSGGRQKGDQQQQRDMGVPPGTPPSAGGQPNAADQPMSKHQGDVLKKKDDADQQ